MNTHYCQNVRNLKEPDIIGFLIFIASAEKKKGLAVIEGEKTPLVQSKAGHGGGKKERIMKGRVGSEEFCRQARRPISVLGIFEADCQ